MSAPSRLALALIFGSLAARTPARAAEPQTPNTVPPTVHAAGRGSPLLFLRDGQKVSTNYADSFSVSHARPLTLTSADFDEDGMPDLASGYAAPDGTGIVTIHRGNVDALWPYGKALLHGEPPAFLPDARVVTLPEAPDFLGAGDFDADGHFDLVAASLGGKTLYLLRGDGHGGFAAPEAIDLPGALTALTTGEINRVDGLTDIAAAVTGENGPQVLVFESPRGALRDKPEAYPMAAAVSALAMMPLDDDPFNDLAVAAGNQLISIHGRDRKLSQSRTIRDSVPAPEITRQTLPFRVRSLTSGHFTSAITDMAALGDDGRVHFLERPDAEYQAARNEMTVRMATPEGIPTPVRKGTRDPGSMPQKPQTRELVLRTDVALPATQESGRLVSAHTSMTKADDVILTDAAGRRLHVISRQGPGSMRLAASLDTAVGAPAAVLPMRLHPSALRGLVVLQQGQAEPSVLLPRIAPENTFTVTNTQDNASNGVESVDTAIPNSLRWAILSANSATGPSLVKFDIPTSDSGYDPNAGTFTIVPLPNTNCGSSSGTLDIPCIGFPWVGTGVTIDGYTQPAGTFNGVTKPAASANTLTKGDNAVLKIVINGAKAGNGEDGLFAEGGSDTFRGLVLNGFLIPQEVSQENAVVGGYGIELESGNNFVEGNFSGTDYTGTKSLPNFIGLGGFAGPNTIGGTLPLARNLSSGASASAVGLTLIADPNTCFIQGNYIGTDRTGTLSLGGAGYDSAGTNQVIGGTQAGAGNLFAGVGTGVFISIGPGNSFNPTGNVVQGNLIGTDVTGAVALPNSTGILITQAEQNQVGGTTPGARNVISGNFTDGIDIVDDSESNIVEGNYIGVDISGSKALANLNYGIGHITFAQSELYAAGTVIGGETPGAANVIGGNGVAGIVLGGQGQIFATGSAAMGATVIGNLIGTDATGTVGVPNIGPGVWIVQDGESFTIGGTDTPAGNIIAFNTSDGVRIDPVFFSTAGTANTGPNTVVGNTIFSNGGAGVRIPSGTGNQVTQNSIYGNTGLGIDIDAQGSQTNINCQTSHSGANGLQNAPVLTAATGGTAFVTATATDPNGNTSEFSHCAAMAVSGSTVTINGMLNSLPNTTYTIEFFQNAACGPSGSGQGKTFLSRLTGPTNSSCIFTFGPGDNISNADLSLSLTYNNQQYTTFVNPSDTFVYQANIANSGPGAASAVSFTANLPSTLAVVSATPTQGTCTIAGTVPTCHLGTMASGATAAVTVTVTVIDVGSIALPGLVSSGTNDPNTLNNTASLTLSSNYPPPFIDHFNPPNGVAGAGAVTLQILGDSFIPNGTTVTVGTTPLTATYSPNGVCGNQFQQTTCQVLTVTVPASLMLSPTTLTVTVTNPTPGGGSYPMSWVVYPNPGTVTQFLITGIPNPALETTSFATNSYNMTVTAADASGHVVPGYRGIVNLTDNVILVPNPGQSFTPASPYQFTAADQGVHTFATTIIITGPNTTVVSDAGTPAIMGSLTVNVNPVYGPPARIIAYGNPGSVPIGFPFPGSGAYGPFEVVIVDAAENALQGVTVTFTAPPLTGASGTWSNGQNVIHVVTDATGTASPVLTANQIAGQFEVDATVNVLTAQFFPTSTTNVPAHISIVHGDNESTPINTQFNGLLDVLVTDAGGAAVPNVPVTFTPPSTGASVNLISNTATTAAMAEGFVAAGVARLDPIGVANGTAGTYQVVAKVGSLSVPFHFTNTPTQGAVASLDTSGTPQSTLLNTPFTNQLVVVPRDANSNCLAQVPVTFTAPSSGPSAKLSATTVKTDALTCAAAVTATANGTKGGPYNVTATAGGQTTTFALTNYLGTSSTLTATYGTPQSAPVGTGFALPLRVLLLDPNGSPIVTQSVSFSAPALGPTATLSKASAFTDVNGNAQINASANSLQGTYAVTASYSPSFGVSLSATFLLTNTAPTIATVRATGGNPQSIAIGTKFAQSLAATVSDSAGNPMSGITVTFTPPASGPSATLSSPTAVTNASGVASVTATANGTLGQYSVGASVGTLGDSFYLTNTAGPPAALTPAGTPQATLVGTAFSAPLQVTVKDSGGNPVSGVTVDFTAPTSGASATLSAPSAVTNSAGVASVTATANATAGGYSVTAKVGTLSATFSLTNSAFSPCDVNTDGTTNVLDPKKMITEGLGTGQPANDLNASGTVNVVDIQIVINAVLKLGCSAS